MNRLNIDKFFNVLICPKCKAEVEYNNEFLVCRGCVGRYPVIDGIPVMMAENPEERKQHDHQEKYFDEHFSKFTDYELLAWRRSYIKRIFEALNIGKMPDCRGEFYLDIGVGGSGYTVIEAAKKGLFSIGTDSSLVAMKKARHFARLQKVEHLTFFVLCYAENLPFKDETFSRLSSIAVLEHIVNDKQAATEVFRVLKPGGRLFVNVPNDFARMSPLLRFPYKIHDKQIGHLRHYSEEDLIKLFGRDRFRTEDIYCTGKLPKLLQMIFNKELMGRFGEKLWWKIENRDFSLRHEKTGVALNVLLRKNGKK